MTVKSFFSRLAKNLSWSALLVMVIVTGLVGGTWLFARGTPLGEQIERLEYPLLDLRHRWYAARTPVTDEVIMVVIRENSLQEFRDNLGRWPWPRRVWAAVIQHLQQAKQIKFDIGFWEPSLVEITPELITDFTNRLDLAKKLQVDQPQAARSALKRIHSRLQELGTPDDQLLGELTANAGNVVHSLTFREPTLLELSSTEIEKEFYRNYGWSLSGPVRGPIQRNIVPPIEPLINSAQLFSHIHFTPDADGVARSFLPFVESSNYTGEERFFPLLGMTGKLTGDERRASYSNRFLKAGDLRLPLDKNGHVPIRYRGRFSEYTVIPVEELIRPMIAGTEPTVPADRFTGKTVIIGATAPGLFDLKPTPLHPIQPGMHVHATIHEMLATGDFLRPERVTITTLAIVLVGVVIGLIVLSFGPFTSLFAMFVILAIYIYTGFLAFGQGYTLNLSLPVLTGILIYGGITTENLLQERKQRRFIRNAFQHYLPDSLLKTLLSDPAQLEMQARRRTVTVLFMDIAGFTSLSENLSATAVAERLNEILSDLSNCVFQHEGIIDKYIGDALMAEFGLLDLEPPQPEQRACRAANEMLQALTAHNKTHPERQLNIRIGINTGEVAAGNMGSRKLFDYTVIGDAVNLASRLEGVNKFYGTRCILSESTQKKLDPGVAVREIDTVQVKGRGEPVTIYEWIGRTEELTEKQLKLLENYRVALEEYRRGNYKKALKIIPADGENDPPSNWLRKRCNELLEAPPGRDWSPVTRLSSK